MQRFQEVNKAIHSVFASDEWKAESIRIYPQNFSGSVETPFMKFTLLDAGVIEGQSINSMSGQLWIDIYVVPGQGNKRHAELADTLDKYFLGKTLDNDGENQGSTQFGRSVISSETFDEPSRSYKVSYVIPFTYYR